MTNNESARSTRAQYGVLRAELEAVASCELGDVLDAWGNLTAEQERRLARYLRSELGAYGMLSNEKARENGESLARERADARRILARLA